MYKQHPGSLSTVRAIMFYKRINFQWFSGVDEVAGVYAQFAAIANRVFRYRCVATVGRAGASQCRAGQLCGVAYATVYGVCAGCYPTVSVLYVAAENMHGHFECAVVVWKVGVFTCIVAPVETSPYS